MPWDRAAPRATPPPAVHHDHVTRAGVLAGLMVLTVLTALAGCTGTSAVPGPVQPASAVSTASTISPASTPARVTWS